MEIQLVKPLCILMYGIPGAGKSTFARQLSEQLNIAHVHSDRIRHELYDDAQYSSAENSTVLRLSVYMAEMLLAQKQSVIFDMQLPTQTLRNNLRSLAREYGAEFITVWVQTDYETALYRATHRDRRRIDDKYSFSITPQLHQRLSSAGSEPRDGSTIVISGKHLFKTQVGPLLRRLKQAGVITNNIPAGKRTGRVDHDRRQNAVR